MSTSLLRTSIVFCVMVLVPRIGNAQVLAYEGFDYPVGSFSQRNGGVGWGAGWNTTTGTTTQGMSLGNLQTVGRAGNIQAVGLANAEGASRILATPATVAVGQELWISFLADSDGGDTNLIDFGSLLRLQSDFGGPWKMTVGLGGGTVSLVTSSPFNSHLYVVRFQVQGPGGGAATLWVDPTPGLQMPDIDPAAAVNFTGTAGSFSQFSAYVMNLDRSNFTSLTFDEIRVTRTYYEAVPVPEPDFVLGVIAVAVVGWICWSGFFRFSTNETVPLPFWTASHVIVERIMSFRFLSVALLVLAVTVSVWADPPKQAEPPEHQSPSQKKAIDLNLLLGTWVRTDKYVGTTMEYYKNGTYLTKGITTRKTQPNGMMGTWKRNGDRLIQTLGPYRTNTSVTIKKLTETEFVFLNHAGQEVTYERVKDKSNKK